MASRGRMARRHNRVNRYVQSPFWRAALDENAVYRVDRGTYFGNSGWCQL